MKAHVLLMSLLVVAAAVLAAEDYEAPLDVGKTGEAVFRVKPQAQKVGDRVKITFALSAPTDVEVAITDGEGKVIRHLAAGLLGRNAPEPLKKNSLSQELFWDGKDDLGRAALPAGASGEVGFKVRVRLGLRATFDRVIGWSGQRVDAPRAMACGPDGTLYVIHGEKFYAHRRTTLISAFDRDGGYLHQVMPGPGGLAKEKREGWPRMVLDDGTEVPIIHHVLTRSAYPGAYLGEGEHSHPAVTGDGRLVLFSGAQRTLGGLIKYPDVRGGRRLLVLGTDGSVPGNFLGPVVADEKTGGAGYIAVSPDSRYAYISGVGATDIWGKTKAEEVHHVVYRTPLDGAGRTEVFIGRLRQPGRGATGLNDPRGIAVDKQGNIYVADVGNSRIAVFKANGDFLEEIPSEAASQIAVSSKTGAVYALVGTRLIKYGGLHDPAGKAELAFPLVNEEVARHTFCMALDDSGERPVLWLSSTRWIRYRLVRVIDRGTSFGTADDPIADAMTQPALPFIMNVAAVGNRLITRTPSFPAAMTSSMVFNTDSGDFEEYFVPKDAKGEKEKRNAVFFCGGEMTAGKDGRVYSQTGGFCWPARGIANPGSLRRYDAKGNALPFDGLGSHFLTKFYHGHHRPAGMFITREGRIYVAAFPGYRGRDQEEKGLKVYVISPAGKMEKEGLVFVKGATVGGLAVDPRGSIYLGVQVWPRGHRVPEWCAKKLPQDTEIGHPGRAYRQHGTLIKFPPSGGKIVPDPNGKYMGHAGGYAKPTEANEPIPVRVEGALWMRRIGFIPINDSDEAGCQCENTRFDVDDYGRLFVPDLYRFRVTVLDSAGNGIVSFGSYGNMDNRGPGSPYPEPDIPFGWPIGVELAGDRVFVADLVNRRVVVTRLAYAAEALCALR